MNLTPSKTETYGIKGKPITPKPLKPPSQSKNEMTDEQKYWYLKGYLESFIENLAIDNEISKKEATKWVINWLQSSV